MVKQGSNCDDRTNDRESQKIYPLFLGRCQFPFYFFNQKTCQFILLNPEESSPVDTFLYFSFFISDKNSLFFVYNTLRLLYIIICSKIGQFGKGLDFKSLLKRVIRFIHRFLTEAVEKPRKDNFLPIFAPIRRHWSG